MEASPESKPRLLYVEYDPIIAGMRHAILVAAGYMVGVVLSAQQALNVVGSEAFDLVILSHTIPLAELNQIAIHVRARRSNLPILMIANGQATHTDLANAFLPEPHHSQELVDAIELLLSGAARA